MTESKEDISLIAHLTDLQRKSETWHCSMVSEFLNEAQQAIAQKYFPSGDTIIYDGGYPCALKRRVIFRSNPEDDFSDIVCLSARIDQRFRRISHRDVLGALMHLQIERSAFGDFWVEEDQIHLYTTSSMADFLIQNLTRINQLSVSFEINKEHPKQVFHTKKMTVIAASTRMDAIVASLSHVSRAKAKEMIRAGLVQLNHITLDSPDKLCDNNGTISIRGKGRFRFLGVIRKTGGDRVAIEIEQSI